MTASKPHISWQTHSGNPVSAGDVTITPQSQALIIRWPFGGFVWNRPAAIRVQYGAQVLSAPIVDVTRVAQVAMLGLSVLCSIVAAILMIRSRRS